jgi:hypothetical protein
MAWRRCLACDKQFVAPKGGNSARYCSDACRTVSVDCANCGKTFQVIRGGTIYCSSDCRHAQHVIKWRETRQRNHAKNREAGRARYLRNYIPAPPRSIVCAGCDKTFVANGPRKYCSLGCRDRAQRCREKQCLRNLSLDQRYQNRATDRDRRRRDRERNPEMRLRDNERNHVYRQRNREYCAKQRARRMQKFEDIPAPRNGEKWSSAENAIVLRDDITIIEMCYMLGRSYMSVSGHRDYQHNLEKIRERNRQRRIPVPPRSIVCVICGETFFAKGKGPRKYCSTDCSTIAVTEQRKHWRPRKRDPEKHRQYSRQYYWRHRETVDDKSKEYYWRHRETLLAKAKQRRIPRPARSIVCVGCSKTFVAKGPRKYCSTDCSAVAAAEQRKHWQINNHNKIGTSK